MPAEHLADRPRRPARRPAGPQPALALRLEKGKPGILGPRQRADSDQAAGNPTDYVLALAPILTEDNQTLGLVEIFQKPNWNPQDLITYTIQVAGYASNYLRNTSNRKVAGQEQVWTQLEVFARQVHGSLNPTEVAYHVANEGRRLIDCDRVSVGIRHGRKTTIEAVSGADVVEKASHALRRMRDLFDAVLQWGEKLVYRGDRTRACRRTCRGPGRLPGRESRSSWSWCRSATSARSEGRVEGAPSRPGR